MLQETRHVQSKVHGSGEVVWVCVHPANYLDDSKESKRKNKLKIELSEAKGSHASMLKTRNPSKLKPILPSEPATAVCLRVGGHMKTTLPFGPL